VYDNGVEKKIVGYRLFGLKFQILLRISAPRGGYWDYELVPLSIFGGEKIVNFYIRAYESRAEKAFIFGEGNINLLRKKSKNKVRILGRSVHRRVWNPPPNRNLNHPIQYL